MWYSTKHTCSNTTCRSMYIVAVIFMLGSGLLDKTENLKTTLKQGSQTSQKCLSYLNILGTRRMTWRKCHAWDPQILGATMWSFVATVTWHLGFVHPCIKALSKLTFCGFVLLSFYVTCQWCIWVNHTLHHSTLACVYGTSLVLADSSV